jgi:molybdate transport system substrate-binding protein
VRRPPLAGLLLRHPFAGPLLGLSRAGLLLTPLLAPHGAAEAPQTSSETLRVFAAVSLQDAFREIARSFEAAHPGTSIELSFAGSQVLQSQIEHGARADVFAAADPAHSDALARKGLLGPARVFARNRLVVAVPRSGAKVRALRDLARPGLKLVVAGPAVPLGRHTESVLKKLAAGAEAGFEPRVRANVVSQETNARAVLAKVALGEADAGFVYASDAGSAAVAALAIPAQANAVAEYPIAVLANSRAARVARAFVEFVFGDAGRAALRRHGFED